MKTTKLFIFALFLFFLLSYMDDYKNLIAPLIGSKKTSIAEDFKGDIPDGKVEEFILKFNRALKEAYLTSDPQNTVNLPLSKELKKAIREEIVFHKNRGLILRYDVVELDLVKIEKLSSAAINATVVEVVDTGYLALSDTKEISREIGEKLEVVYSIIVGSRGWMIVGFDIVNKGDIDAKKTAKSSK